MARRIAGGATRTHVPVLEIDSIVLSLLFPRAQPVYTSKASASGEKTELFGMFRLAQARAREPICVQCQIALAFLLLLVLQQKNTRLTGLRYKKSHIQAPETTFSKKSATRFLECQGWGWGGWLNPLESTLTIKKVTIATTPALKGLGGRCQNWCPSYDG